MRIVPITIASPGMRIGRSIFDTRGRLVLSAGVTLQPRLIELLMQQGYSAVYIADSLVDVELPEIISVSTRQQVIDCVKDFSKVGFLSKAPEGSRVPIREVTRSSSRKSEPDTSLAGRISLAAEILVKEVISTPEVMIGMVDLRSKNDLSFAHSVQVGLLSIVVGKIMGLSPSNLRELGVGSILHDIGITTMPDSVLAVDEFHPRVGDPIREHPMMGFQLLKATHLSLLASHVAFQHHERWDGSGYPRGLHELEIMRYARICGACDVFDSMTAERPDGPAVHPFEALGYLTSCSGTLFDPAVIRAIGSSIAPYPVATSVMLSTGETAVVKKLNRLAIDKPIVVVVKDQNRKYYKDFREIDLSLEDVTITRYVSWYEDEGPDQSEAEFNLARQFAETAQG